MGPLGVIEIDPVADDPFGDEAVAQLMEIDRLVYENSSAMLAKEFSFWVHVLPAAIVCLAIVFAMRIAVQRAYTR